MNTRLTQARLLLLGGAALFFCGALLLAVARWNLAEADRAFVDAAAQAIRQAAAPEAEAPLRLWMPIGTATPRPPGARARADDLLRLLPPTPNPAHRGSSQ